MGRVSDLAVTQEAGKGPGWYQNVNPGSKTLLTLGGSKSSVRELREGRGRGDEEGDPATGNHSKTVRGSGGPL